MQKEQFLLLLKKELIGRGIPSEAAEGYVRRIAGTLSEKDIAEIDRIEDTEDVAKLARGIVMLKQRTNTPPKKAAPAEDDVKVYHGSGNANNTAHHKQPAQTELSAVDYEDYIHDDEPEQPETTRGRRVFWLIFICALPLTLIALLAYFGVFAAAFAALCALIVVLVAGLIGGAAVGAVVSLVGIIYGITQLITAASAAPGLYEIGLGITVGGIVMAAGILVYNVAIRLVPLLIRLLSSLFGICTGKLRTLFNMAKEACYKL